MNEKMKKLITQAVIVVILVVVMAFINRGPKSADSDEGAKQQEVASATTENTAGADVEAEERQVEGDEPLIEKDGSYTDKDSVALYIKTYGHLPENYITKEAADELGWDSKAGNLQEIAPGMSIGGGHFGNYDETLPEQNGRKYQECDVDYEGGHRNAKRIVFSNDGLIFYTDDHYKTFEQLY